MKYLASLALLLITCQSVLAVDRETCATPIEAGGMMTNTATGEKIYFPTTFHLHRIDSGDVRIFDDTDQLANIQLSGDVTPVFLLYGDKGELKDLTLETAEKIFGKVAFKAHSERNPDDKLYRFDFKTSGASLEPNIFHVDFEAGSDGKFKSYRVRGIGIARPDWQTIGTQISTK